MKYFKNTELARLYSVSEKSVRNWVHAAQEGKLDLQLHEEKDKFYVANTSKNTFLIEQIASKGKKYKNSRAHKALIPTQKFKDTYSTRQVLDIISNLSIRSEIPLQYSYVDGGAQYWNQFANRLMEEEAPNNLNKTIELIGASFENVNNLVGQDKKVNVVDLGPGNGLPIRDLLARLHSQGRLLRYVAIDSSKEMLDIVEKNIATWFNNEVAFEGHMRDISHDRFDDLLAMDPIDQDGTTPTNLVCLLGGTLSNFRYPGQALQAINNSLGVQDILIYTEKLDAPITRRYFDFNVTNQVQKLTPRHKLILDFLNIDESLYDVEQTFDSNKRARFITVKPRIDLSIDFELPTGVKRVSLQKGKPIILWRAWHWDVMDLANHLDENGFNIMQLLRSKSEEYILMISKLKIEE